MTVVVPAVDVDDEDRSDIRSDDGTFADRLDEAGVGFGRLSTVAAPAKRISALFAYRKVTDSRGKQFFCPASLGELN